MMNHIKILLLLVLCCNFTLGQNIQQLLDLFLQATSDDDDGGDFPDLSNFNPQNFNFTGTIGDLFTVDEESGNLILINSTTGNLNSGLPPPEQQSTPTQGITDPISTPQPLPISATTASPIEIISTPVTELVTHSQSPVVNPPATQVMITNPPTTPQPIITTPPAIPSISASPGQLTSSSSQLPATSNQPSGQLAGTTGQFPGQFPVLGSQFSGQLPVSGGQLPVQTGQFPGQFPGTFIPAAVQFQNQFPVTGGFFHGQPPRPFPSFGQIPNQGQFPVSSQFPNQGQFPVASQFPNQGQFPVASQFPNQGQFPVVSQFPNQGQFPVTSQFPNLGQIPGSFSPVTGGQFSPVTGGQSPGTGGNLGGQIQVRDLLQEVKDADSSVLIILVSMCVVASRFN
ncbi:B-cell CLL/lymphoma 9 protein-like [Macrobrachium nipponense]|uniref:B-cell CLL/lymphoma 9 protein-like n=1 Tax=Macrobrachium nipponense TaxID=159736 RepID=UPI0030C8649D